MTPRQIDRAKILRDALRSLPKIRRLNSQKDTPHETRSGLTLQANGERPYVHSFGVDRRTGQKILIAAERIIRDELADLGVRIERRRR